MENFYYAVFLSPTDCRIKNYRKENRFCKLNGADINANCLKFPYGMLPFVCSVY